MWVVWYQGLFVLDLMEPTLRENNLEQDRLSKKYTRGSHGFSKAEAIYVEHFESVNSFFKSVIRKL